MSQQEIFDVIVKNPGIEQQFLKSHIESHANVSDQVIRLVRNGKIRREHTKRSWKLYPTEGFKDVTVEEHAI